MWVTTQPRTISIGARRSGKFSRVVGLDEHSPLWLASPLSAKMGVRLIEATSRGQSGLEQSRVTTR